MDSGMNTAQEESKAITKELLETAIRSYEGRNDIAIKTFTIKWLPALGYGSVTFTVAVTAEINSSQKIYKLFIKTSYDNELLKQYLLRECRQFAKEEMVYKQVIPDMIGIQTDRGLTPFGPSLPTFYHSVVDDDNGIIILENMQYDGYVIADKKTGLDYDQCKLVMKELAIFHALSYAIKQKSRENLNKYNYLFHETIFPLKSFVVKSLEASVQAVRKVSRDPKIKEYATRLLTLDLDTTIRDLLKPAEPFSVICHGDVWCNNLLFKYTNGKKNEKPLHVRLIDLQAVRYALPTTDLSYFFYTSTTKSLREKHFYDLLRYYHSTFMESLEKLDIPLPDFTFQSLEKLYKGSVMFGILMAFFYMPAMLFFSDQASIDFVETDDDLDKYVEKICKQIDENSEYISIIKERFVGAIEDAVAFEAL